jgi:hypothetical protein
MPRPLERANEGLERKTEMTRGFSMYFGGEQ